GMSSPRPWTAPDHRSNPATTGTRRRMSVPFRARDRISRRPLDERPRRSDWPEEEWPQMNTDKTGQGGDRRTGVTAAPPLYLCSSVAIVSPPRGAVKKQTRPLAKPGRGGRGPGRPDSKSRAAQDQEDGDGPRPGGLAAVEE